MGKPLSQDEIDHLLKVGTDIQKPEDLQILEAQIREETRQERIRPYNFKRPRLFSQEQMRMLSLVHEAFARELAVHLSAQLRTIVDVRLMAVDQMLYSEYVMSSETPSALYVVEARKMRHRFVIELDPRLIIFIVEKLFGGTTTRLGNSRAVTQIEQGILSKVMRLALREMEVAWKRVVETRLEILTFESNAEFIQIMTAGAAVFVLTFEVIVYEQPTTIVVCYPHLLLERMLERSNLNQWMVSSVSEISEVEQERHKETLQTVYIELGAQLGRTLLPLQDLMQLEVGDVIPLERRVSEPIPLLVNNQERFKAVVGKSGRHRAVRILERIHPTTLKNDG